MERLFHSPSAHSAPRVGALVLSSKVLMSAAALATVEVPQSSAGFGETALFTGSEMSLERDAELLVCGSWPDKGLTITEADLDGICARFSADTIPIKVEHTDSPLDPLGLVKSVQRVGNKLMGKLAFPADLHGFLQRRGVSKLSVGLERSPVSLAEVSLVLKPRVASAAMLSANSSEGGGAGGGGDTAELSALRAELRKQVVDGQIAELKRAGKVIPAVEALARVLLSADSSALVTLSDGSSRAVSATTFQLLSALPPLVRLSETAPDTAGGEHNSDQAAPLSPEQEEFLRTRLGVDPAKVKETMAADVKAKEGGAS